MQALSSTLLLVTSLLAGCSGSAEPASVADAGAGPIVTSADGRQRLVDMNDAEFGAWCRDVTDYTSKTVTDERVQRFGCGIVSLFAKLDPTGTADKRLLVARCESRFDKCIKEPVGPDASALSCAVLRAEATRCTATVEEVDGCFQEQAELVRVVSAWGRLICDETKASPLDAKALVRCNALPPGCESFKPFTLTSTGS